MQIKTQKPHHHTLNSSTPIKTKCIDACESLKLYSGIQYAQLIKRSSNCLVLLKCTDSCSKLCLFWEQWHAKFKYLHMLFRFASHMKVYCIGQKTIPWFFLSCKLLIDFDRNILFLKKSAKLARHSTQDCAWKGVPSNCEQNWYDNILNCHLTIKKILKYCKWSLRKNLQRDLKIWWQWCHSPKPA